ncbi:MAG: Druantia anti-phage system protein DruA [Ferrovibrio sp.]
MARKKKKTKHTNVIGALTREANLKRRLRRHLKAIGFSRDNDGNLKFAEGGKEVVRSLHLSQRSALIRANRQFIEKQYPKLFKYFASGADISPLHISPRLELIKSGTWQGDLFRLAALTWAVPVSNGFGRRLRYLVWDDHNNKLIGLIAIGDPVFNLSVRDQHIGWTAKDRNERLVNIMDAFVLGAIPPYNQLLGGKLVASLVRTRKVYDDFTRTYGKSAGIISGKEKKARLLAVTTSSSLGRSSVYNRLKLDGQSYFEPIGYTRGYGHFHIPDELFEDLRKYLRDHKLKYADEYSYGEGPNWKLRTTRAALTALGIRRDLMKHGIQREVFLSPFTTNATTILKSGKGRPKLDTLLTVEQVGHLALQRWIIPRAIRHPDFLTWEAAQIGALLNVTARIQRSAEKQLSSRNVEAA